MTTHHIPGESSPTPPEIDPEFQARCGRLREHEQELLRRQLKSEGCRDAIKTWRGIALDGHHRLAICLEEGIPYRTEEIDLPDRVHALHWIDCWQAGRRNEDKADRDERIGRIYEFRKQQRGGDRRSDTATNGPKRKSCALVPGADSTAEQVGAEFGVSARTVEGNAEYVRGLNRIEAAHGQDARRAAKRTKTKQEIRDIGTGKAPMEIEPSKAPDPVRDQTGKVVPEKLRPVFEAVDTFKQLEREHGKLMRAIESLAETDAGKWLHLEHIRANLRSARGTLKFARPYALCPYPHEQGNECGACHDLGWVQLTTYDNAPKDR